MDFIYDEMLPKNYYNYDTIKTLFKNPNIFASADNVMKGFFNVLLQEDGTYAKEEGIGMALFANGALSQKLLYQQIKDDYHSDIEFSFGLAPTGPNGGFAYMSPSKGICVNKNSVNLDWALEFMNYLFCRDINMTFAENSELLPNTVDVFQTVSNMYKIPEKNISHVGEVSFSYNFYSAWQKGFFVDLKDTDKVTILHEALSKANSPQRLVNGEIRPYSYYYDYYLEMLDTI